MSRNYQSDLLTIAEEDRILYFTVLKDKYDNTDITGIKNYFTELFEYFTNNQTPSYYGCVFDLKVMSTYNMIKYAGILKDFFKEHKQVLHKYIGCTSIVINNSFIRTILGPIIQFVNKGRPFTFTRDTDIAVEFVTNELEKLNTSTPLTPPPPPYINHTNRINQTNQSPPPPYLQYDNYHPAPQVAPPTYLEQQDDDTPSQPPQVVPQVAPQVAPPTYLQQQDDDTPSQPPQVAPPQVAPPQVAPPPTYREQQDDDTQPDDQENPLDLD